MLTDRYLPDYHYHEVHHIEAAGTTAQCYAATQAVDLSKSKIILWLLRLRGLPTSQPGFSDFTRQMKFTLLEAQPPEEFIYGFGLKKEVEWITDIPEFAASTDFRAKVIWHFSFAPTIGGQTRITTETRVHCQDKVFKRFFSIYWFFIRPFSGLIRMEMLRLIKKDVES